MKVRWGRGEKLVIVWKHDWLPPSETFVRDQMSALSEWTPVLAGLRRSEISLPLSQEVIVAPRLARFAGRFRYQASLILIALRVWPRVKRARHAIIHAHFGQDAVSAAVLARLLRVGLVVTFHGYDVSRAAWRDDAETIRYRRKLGEVFDRSSALIAVSSHVRARLLALGAPEPKVTTLHTGTSIPTAAQPSRGLAARDGILFVGRLVEKKGVEHLLRAVAKIEGIDAEIQVVGEGPLRDQLQSIASTLGLNVNFLGRRSPAEVRNLMLTSAVLAVPSVTASNGDEEGLPTTLLEGAAYGAALVAYDHAGIPDFVEDGVTGILIREGDIEALSNGLARVLADSALRMRLSEEARSRVESDFNIFFQTRYLERLYDRVSDNS